MEGRSLFFIGCMYNEAIFVDGAPLGIKSQEVESYELFAENTEQT